MSHAKHRKPDVTGIYGQAWRHDLKKAKRDPDHEASLASWLLNVRGAHPFWAHWMVGLIHLRDLPGVRSAHKQYPEAEFELMIITIDPTRCPWPHPDDVRKGYPFLTPVDVSAQFHGVTDRDAVRIGELAVRAMVDGHLSPDQDFRAAWREVLQATAAHFRAGKHPEH